MKIDFFQSFFLILVFSASALVAEDPWGMDSELAFSSVPVQAKNSSWIAGADAVILFHQQVISPADGPRSHFIPSSSTYALQAIRRYGFFTGFCMGCDRLLRENSDPWIYPHITTRDGDILKWNPVP